ncbi:MAG TPA: sulfotransferase [Acidimicrobiales bacterium]|nr:sulfotransferase [Acidimicrobiales bacterium]
MAMPDEEGQTVGVTADTEGRPPMPIFVGCGRSGTTLIRAMFDSHSKLAVSHHAQFIVAMGRRRESYEAQEGFRTDRFLTDLFASHRFPLLLLEEAVVRDELREPPSSYPEAVRRVLALYARQKGKSRYGDKTPGHVLRIALLGDLFPEARFVHIVRDGRNSWLGYRDRGFGPSTLPDAAFNWKRRVSRGRAAGLTLGAERYREVRYEDLVEHPAQTLAPLCRFLDLEFEEDMLRYYERAESVLAGMGAAGRVAFEGVAQRPTAGLRDWRNTLSSEELALFDAIAGDLLVELGYEPAGSAVSPSVKLEFGKAWLGWQRRRAGFQLKAAGRRLLKRSPGHADADWGHLQPKSLPVIE